MRDSCITSSLMPSNSFRLCIPQSPPPYSSFFPLVLSLFFISFHFPPFWLNSSLSLISFLNPKTHLGAILVHTTLKKTKRTNLKKNDIYGLVQTLHFKLLL